MERTVQRVREHFRELENIRRSWEPTWRDVRDLVVPARGRALEGTDPAEANTGIRHDKRINGTTSRALKVLSAGIQSGVTSKARQWFVLGYPDPKINSYRPVREWYDEVQHILEGLFRRTNFYSASLHTYEEMAGFGQGAMAILEHPDTVFYCRTFTTGTYWMGTDQYGEIDTFFYREVMTVRQMKQRYGDSLPDAIKSQEESGRLEEKHTVVVGIFKHPEVYGLTKEPGRPVTSVHFLDRDSGNTTGSDEFLKVSGYRMWPLMTPRWDVVDADVYGTAPMFDVLADTKTLQAMESDILKGAAKIVTPPMRAPSSLRRQGINSAPGGLTYVDSLAADALAPLYAVGLDINSVQAKENLLINDIKEGLYNSLFLALLMQDNPQMTAREVTERHEEKLLMLGPVLERIHGEYLDPVIHRVFQIAWDSGLIPPPPEELGPEVPTTIEYISILSQAQKAIGVNRIEQSVQFIGTLMAACPEARHMLKPFDLVNQYNEMIGTPTKLFASESEYKDAVQQEQQQSQLAAEAPVAESMANAAKAIGDADLANVNSLLGGMSGGPVL